MFVTILFAPMAFFIFNPFVSFTDRGKERKKQLQTIHSFRILELAPEVGFEPTT